MIILRAVSAAHHTPLFLRSRHQDVCLPSLVRLAGRVDSDGQSLISRQLLARDYPLEIQKLSFLALVFSPEDRPETRDFPHGVSAAGQGGLSGSALQ